MTTLQALARLERQQHKQDQQQLNDAWYSFVARPTCPPSTSICVQGGTCIAAASEDRLARSGVDQAVGLAWTVPNLVRDLADEGDADFDAGLYISPAYEGSYTEVSWITPGYYKGGILSLLIPEQFDQPTATDWRLRVFCFTEEFATSEEAEAWLMSWQYNGYNPYDPALGFVGPWDYQYWPYAVWANTLVLPFTYWLARTGMPLCGLILRNNGTVGTGRHFLPIDVLNRGRSYTWPRDMRPQWVNK